MKRFIVILSVIALLVFPIASAQAATTQEELDMAYRNALFQLITLLMEQVKILQAQLAVLQAQEAKVAEHGAIINEMTESPATSPTLTRIKCYLTYFVDTPGKVSRYGLYWKDWESLTRYEKITGTTHGECKEVQVSAEPTTGCCLDERYFKPLDEQ